MEAFYRASADLDGDHLFTPMMFRLGRQFPLLFVIHIIDDPLEHVEAMRLHCTMLAMLELGCSTVTAFLVTASFCRY